MKYPQGDADAKIRGDKRNLDYNVGVMQPIVLSLGVANAQLDLPFAGDFLHIDSSSTGQISVKFDTAMAAGFPMKTNTTIKDFPYRRVLVSWAAQPGKTVTLWYGYGVNIVPPNQDITSIGSITNAVNLAPSDANYYHYGDFPVQQSQMMAGYGLAGASAGNISTSQLWNPVGSGVILYVDEITVGEGTAAELIYFRLQNAVIGGLAMAGINMNNGGAAAKGEIHTSNPAAGTGTLFHGFYMSTNGVFTLPQQGPIRLPAGSGVSVESGVVNHAVVGNFKWRELTV